MKILVCAKQKAHNYINALEHKNSHTVDEIKNFEYFIELCKATKKD